MEEVCCTIAEFEKQALSILEADVADYYQGGATSEQTMKNNRKAFTKLRLRPRVMQDVRDRDSSLTVLGRRHLCPVGISPTAMQKLAHSQGEVAMAKAAGAMDAIMILSILSTTSLEEVRQKNPDTTLWMQLYIFKERDITLNLVRRAEAAGYSALVLTMDTAVLGSRYRDLKNKFAMPPYLTLENFRNIKQHDEDLSKFSSPPGECVTGLTDYISTQFDDSVCWDDVKWLINFTKLPVICKGILTGADALQCHKVGARGIIVSNHGGRQLDQTPATIEALPEVVKAAGDKIEIYMDGGIRYGTDIFKAVGLGAKYVFVGRAALYGLAYSGWNGAAKVLKILNFEFDQTLALCGCNSTACIKQDMIVHQKYYEDLLSSSSNLQSELTEKVRSSPSSTSLNPERKESPEFPEDHRSIEHSTRSQGSKKNTPQRRQSICNKKVCKDTVKQVCYSYKKNPGRKGSFDKQKSFENVRYRPKCFTYKKSAKTTRQQKYNKFSCQSQKSFKYPEQKNYPEEYYYKKIPNNNMKKNHAKQRDYTINKYCDNLLEKLNNTKRNCSETCPKQGQNVGFCNSACKASIEYERSYDRAENDDSQNSANESLCSSCIKNSSKQRHNEEVRDCTENHIERKDDIERLGNNNGNLSKQRYNERFHNSTEDLPKQKLPDERSCKCNESDGKGNCKCSQSFDFASTLIEQGPKGKIHIHACTNVHSIRVPSKFPRSQHGRKFEKY